MGKRALIIGAGPAGLTAALELLRNTDIKPIVFEKSGDIGGLSRTIEYRGNRMDIGGHRFFSKSDRVMDWWREILPIAHSDNSAITLTYHNQKHTIASSTHVDDSNVLLVRSRRSRILFSRQFFEYPIALTPDTLKKLGLLKAARMGASYAYSVLRPIKPETNLEQFLINRFGKQLYKTFFKSYTEKVWGVECHNISAAWGAQRIKGLSIARAIKHFLTPRSHADIAQKNTETSLIQYFLYPKYGPGQLWQEVARRVVEGGGVIKQQMSVDYIETRDNRVTHVGACNSATGVRELLPVDYVFSTMPVQELIVSMRPAVPEAVKIVADGLLYRDFITVGILLKNFHPALKEQMRDNWIYVQESDVLVGRIQIFNNWSPYMVANPAHVWLGLEYFCFETDELWSKTEAELIQLAIDELTRLRLIDPRDVLDGVAVKVEKTYPAYFGSYNRFDEIRAYLDRFANLFLIGRNGMHKYNNQDHSMLTAMAAVENIVRGVGDKSNIWAVNAEQEYHEEK